MRRNDWIRDRELARALRRLDPPTPTPAQLASLARRIVARATPLLDPRRRAASSWLEYAAAWAGTLLPQGETPPVYRWLAQQSDGVAAGSGTESAEHGAHVNRLGSGDRGVGVAHLGPGDGAAFDDELRFGAEEGGFPEDEVS